MIYSKQLRLLSFMVCCVFLSTTLAHSASQHEVSQIPQSNLVSEPTIALSGFLKSFQEKRDEKAFSSPFAMTREIQENKIIQEISEETSLSPQEITEAVIYWTQENKRTLTHKNISTIVDVLKVIKRMELERELPWYFRLLSFDESLAVNEEVIQQFAELLPKLMETEEYKKQFIEPQGANAGLINFLKILGHSDADISEIILKLKQRGTLPSHWPERVVTQPTAEKVAKKFDWITGDKLTRTLKKIIIYSVWGILVMLAYGGLGWVLESVWVDGIPLLLKLLLVGLAFSIFIFHEQIIAFTVLILVGDIGTGNWGFFALKMTSATAAYKLFKVIDLWREKGFSVVQTEAIALKEHLLKGFSDAYVYLVDWYLYFLFGLTVGFGIYWRYRVKKYFKAIGEQPPKVEKEKSSFFGAVFLAPITEEITFRYLFLNLIFLVFPSASEAPTAFTLFGSAFPMWIIVPTIINALYFYVAHEKRKGFYHFLLGAAFTLIYYASGNLMVVITLHFAWNLFADVTHSLSNSFFQSKTFSDSSVGATELKKTDWVVFPAEKDLDGLNRLLLRVGGEERQDMGAGIPLEQSDTLVLAPHLHAAVYLNAA